MSNTLDVDVRKRVKSRIECVIECRFMKLCEDFDDLAAYDRLNSRQMLELVQAVDPAIAEFYEDWLIDGDALEDE